MITSVESGFRKSFWNWGRKAFKQRYLFLLSLPIIVWLFVFAYIPLIGWSYAFVDYSPGISIFASKFVGFKHFMEMLTEPRFFNALKNTVIMAFLGISLAGFLCPVVFAVVLNEVKNMPFKRTVQTISYLPHFVSWVVVAGMFMQFLSTEGGAVNDLLVSLHIIGKPVNFMGIPDYFYSIITSSTIWKELGWNAIIYISAMAGIDQTLYEAANVDGAGRLRKIWHITLPGIKPTIVILLIMNIGGLVNGGFETQLLFTNGLNASVAEVLNLYVLNYGIKLLHFSYGTAAGIFISFVSFVLVFAANSISKRTTELSLF